MVRGEEVFKAIFCPDTVSKKFSNVNYLGEEDFERVCRTICDWDESPWRRFSHEGIVGKQYFHYILSGVAHVFYDSDDENFKEIVFHSAFRSGLSKLFFDSDIHLPKIKIVSEGGVEEIPANDGISRLLG